MDSLLEAIETEMVVKSLLSLRGKCEEEFFEEANTYEDTNYGPQMKREFVFPNGQKRTLNPFQLLNEFKKMDFKEKKLFHMSYETLGICLRGHSNLQAYYICSRFFSEN